MDSDANVTQEPASPLTDDQRARILNRYRDLVDQKYLKGLSDIEQEEMDDLGSEIDGFHDEFYAPILADLRERLKSRPPDTVHGPRPFGLAAGEFTVPDDFDAPLPEAILDEFEGL